MTLARTFLSPGKEDGTWTPHASVVLGHISAWDCGLWFTQYVCINRSPSVLTAKLLDYGHAQPMPCCSVSLASL